MFKSMATLIVWTVCAGALWVGVWQPNQQNQIVRAASQNTEQMSIPLARRHLRAIQSVKTWDPYLKGVGQMAEARLLGRLGRIDDAAQTYAQAMVGRVPFTAHVEFGLFYLEIGAMSEAERQFEYASEAGVRLAPLLRNDYLLRRQIEEALED